MALQAFVDDSGSNRKGHVFVLAGFMATYDNWMAFADQWEKALAETTAIDYYKNSAAMARRDQFDGWSHIDVQKKINRLILVINQFALWRISVAITYNEFDRWLQVNDFDALTIPRDPYFLLFYRLITNVVRGCDIATITPPLSFIFDQQGTMGLRAQELFDTFTRHLHPRQREYFASHPTFANDRVQRPLQAADLYAGNIRHFYIDNKTLYMPLQKSLKRLMDIPSIAETVDAKRLAKRIAELIPYFLPAERGDDDD